LLKIITKQAPTDDDQIELGRLEAERRTLQSELTELAVALSRREVATLEQVQAAIPPVSLPALRHARRAEQRQIV
jgi:hypothetical protein